MASFINDISNFFSGGKNAEGDKALRNALDEFGTLQTPDIAQMQLQLDQLVQQGILSPEEAQVYLQNPSAMNQISTDPKLQQAQMDALASLQEIGQGGMTDMDRAQLAKIAQDEAIRSRGAREAILQNMEARGAGGSGASLLAQLQNSQDAANRQSMRDTEVAGMAQQRALQALQGAGQMGGQMQNTQFNQQAQVAQANDAINQFNTQNRQQVGNLNTSARNTAAAQNLAEKQRVADTNVGTANTQQQYNKQLPQQNFQNKLSVAQGKAGVNAQQAGAANAAAQGNRDMFGNLIQTGAMAAMAFSDERLKKDVQDFDPGQFLDDVTGYKYKYKNPKHGQGEQVGVMAQDVEKNAPELVIDTPEGKMIDYGKSGGLIFASLADLHKRLREMEDE